MGKVLYIYLILNNLKISSVFGIGIIGRCPVVLFVQQFLKSVIVF